MKALILAGGYSTRLWPLTKERAKPLLLINGKPLISHIVEKIPKGIQIYVATNRKFRTEFGRWRKTVEKPVQLIIEDTSGEEEKLGAVGGVANFINENRIAEDLLVIAGDNYFGLDLKEFLRAYHGFPLVAAHNVKNFAEARKYGVLSTSGGKITSFHEKPKVPDSTLVSTGVYLLPETTFLLLNDYLRRGGEAADNIGSFIQFLLKKTEIQAYVFLEEWFDIGSFEGYLEAHKQKRRERKRARGGNGYYGVDFFGGANKFSGAVFVDKGSFIENSSIHDSIVLEGCHIENSMIKNCIVDEGSVILNSEIEFMLVEAKSRIKNQEIKRYSQLR